jgi:hypothetical protein
MTTSEQNMAVNALIDNLSYIKKQTPFLVYGSLVTSIL